jgi:AraC-like DNA-binding protein
MPLNQILDQRVALADLLPSACGRAPRALRLEADLEPAAAAQRVLDVAGRLITGGTPDPAMACAAAMLADPAARAEQVATEIGLSERQLRRRCHAAVGYGPKTLQRVLRFQRFVRMLDASGGTVNLAEGAAAAGYADQAHLTRECGALSGLPPAVLARTRR